jgi:hypothetical protein
MYDTLLVDVCLSLRRKPLKFRSSTEWYKLKPHVRFISVYGFNLDHFFPEGIHVACILSAVAAIACRLFFSLSHSSNMQIALHDIFYLVSPVFFQQHSQTILFFFSCLRCSVCAIDRPNRDVHTFIVFSLLCIITLCSNILLRYQHKS